MFFTLSCRFRTLVLPCITRLLWIASLKYIRRIDLWKIYIRYRSSMLSSTWISRLIQHPNIQPENNINNNRYAARLAPYVIVLYFMCCTILCLCNGKSIEFATVQHGWHAAAMVILQYMKKTYNDLDNALKFENSSVEVWEWIRNFIPHFPEHVITYPWLN